MNGAGLHVHRASLLLWAAILALGTLVYTHAHRR